jgi:catechol 2,3-dioxygenase-like lactoylglutathione lyase family enzyme
VRGEGLDNVGRAWRHVGNQDVYVALQAVPIHTPRAPYDNGTGLNHLGWEVADVAVLETRMRDAGFSPSSHAEPHPARRRVYFLDPEGNDWEFVEYLSNDPAARNRYHDV